MTLRYFSGTQGAFGKRWDRWRNRGAEILCYTGAELADGVSGLPSCMKFGVMDSICDLACYYENYARFDSRNSSRIKMQAGSRGELSLIARLLRNEALPLYRTGAHRYLLGREQ